MNTEIQKGLGEPAGLPQGLQKDLRALQGCCKAAGSCTGSRQAVQGQPKGSQEVPESAEFITVAEGNPNAQLPPLAPSNTQPPSPDSKSSE